MFTKVRWSPWAGRSLTGWPTHTIVNGEIAFENGRIRESVRGRPLTYLDG
jgi:dihydroorotase-like cyclic amidohydrolase